MGHDIRRRDAIRAGLGSLSWFALPQRPRDSGVLSFRLIEPAGLRRVAEPISAMIPVEGENLRFRLVRDGRATPAQFGPLPADGGRTAWRLDFAADLGPDETARFELHHGALIEPGPGPIGRWDLEATPDDFRIARDRVPVFLIDRLLRPPGPMPDPNRRDGFRRFAPSPTITLRDGGTIRPETAVTSTVTREGPFALGLRFAWSGPGRVASRFDLDFPSTRDQAAVRWMVDDPEDRVESIRLELDAGPIQQPAATRSGPRWATSEYPHRRILAVVEGEGGPGEPASVEISPEGRLKVARRFAKSSRARTLAFRFDVSGPAGPSGRIASVESLLRPIRLEWDRPAPSRA